MTTKGKSNCFLHFLLGESGESALGENEKDRRYRIWSLPDWLSSYKTILRPRSVQKVTNGSDKRSLRFASGESSPGGVNAETEGVLGRCHYHRHRRLFIGRIREHQRAHAQIHHLRVPTKREQLVSRDQSHCYRWGWLINSRVLPRQRNRVSTGRLESVDCYTSSIQQKPFM